MAFYCCENWHVSLKCIKHKRRGVELCGETVALSSAAGGGWEKWAPAQSRRGPESAPHLWQWQGTERSGKAFVVASLVPSPPFQLPSDQKVSVSWWLYGHYCLDPHVYLKAVKTWHKTKAMLWWKWSLTPMKHYAALFLDCAFPHRWPIENANTSKGVFLIKFQFTVVVLLGIWF